MGLVEQCSVSKCVLCPFLSSPLCCGPNVGRVGGPSERRQEEGHRDAHQRHGQQRETNSLHCTQGIYKLSIKRIDSVLSYGSVYLS